MPQGVLHGESARQRSAAQKTAISAMGIGPPRLSRSAGGCGLSYAKCLRFSAAQTHTPQNALAKAHAERRCRRQVNDTASGIDGKGELRFTRLSELVEGVSQKMLTQTLRHMEHDGLITNYDVTAGHSPR
jgi:hypothetical protein